MALASSVIRRRVAVAVVIVAAGVVVGALHGVEAAMAWASAHPVKATMLLLLAMYLPSYLDGAEYTVESRVWPAFARQPCWRRAARYVNGTVDVDGPPLRKDKQYIMTCHPHGAVTYNHVLFFTDSCSTLREGLLPDPQGVADGAARQTAPEGSPGSDAAADRASSGWFRRDLGARILFKIPIWRDVLLWLGLVDAGRPVAEAVLRRGGSLFIYPGGEREQIAVARGQHVALTKRHLGFIRLALRHGVGIVPGYAFGEVDLYHTSNFLINFRRWLVRTLAIALPIFFGRGLTIVPLAGCRVGVVFGRELEVPKASAPPSLEQVEDLAERYRKELQRIFEENKSRFGLDEGTQLELR